MRIMEEVLLFSAMITHCCSLLWYWNDLVGLILLYSSGQPQNLNPPASASMVLELQERATVSDCLFPK